MGRLVQTIALGAALLALGTGVWRDYGTWTVLERAGKAYLAAYLVAGVLVLITRGALGAVADPPPPPPEPEKPRRKRGRKRQTADGGAPPAQATPSGDAAAAGAPGGQAPPPGAETTAAAPAGEPAPAVPSEGAAR
jgi:hypothetical protein